MFYLAVFVSASCHPEILSNKMSSRKRISVEKWLRCGARLHRPTGIKGSVMISQTAASTITAQMLQVNEKL